MVSLRSLSEHPHRLFDTLGLRFGGVLVRRPHLIRFRRHGTGTSLWLELAERLNASLQSQSVVK